MQCLLFTISLGRPTTIYQKISIFLLISQSTNIILLHNNKDYLLCQKREEKVVVERIVCVVGEII